MDADIRGEDPAKFSLLSDDMRRELDRQEWERQAKLDAGENPDDMGPARFQKVLTSDRRDYGTGYFAFSTDEEERANQMTQLKDLRAETLTQRSKREQLKQVRSQRQADRITKIKQRRLNGGQALPLSAGEHSLNVEEEEEQQFESVDDLLAFYRQSSTKQDKA